MGRRFFDYDPHTGVTEWFHATDDGVGFRIEYTQDIEPIIEANKAAFNTFSSARESFGDGMTLNGRSHVASIPAVIHAKLTREGIIRDPKALRRWLNDPDNAVFRTRPGHL
jgi:hypothetical protein